MHVVFRYLKLENLSWKGDIIHQYLHFPVGGFQREEPNQSRRELVLFIGTISRR